MNLSIALIGDYNEEVIAHKAIPQSIDLASKSLGFDSNTQWISTQDSETKDLKGFPFQRPFRSTRIVPLVDFV